MAIAQAIVETASPSCPELDDRWLQAIAAPMLGQRDFDILELLFGLDEPGVEAGAIHHDTGLMAGVRPQL